MLRKYSGSLERYNGVLDLGTCLSASQVREEAARTIFLDIPARHKPLQDFRAQFATKALT